MEARSEIEKKISKKRDEINDPRRKLHDAEIWVQALEEGNAADARNAILEAGYPLHLDDLLKVMGKAVTRAGRRTLKRALSAHVRKGEIFTSPARDTFGLYELTALDYPTDYRRDDEDIPF